MPEGPRTKSSSLSEYRSRFSAWLTADWVRPRRAPARVTLRSSSRTSNTRSRFRSGVGMYVAHSSRDDLSFSSLRNAHYLTTVRENGVAGPRAPFSALPFCRVGDLHA